MASYGHHELVQVRLIAAVGCDAALLDQYDEPAGDQVAHGPLDRRAGQPGVFHEGRLADLYAELVAVVREADERQVGGPGGVRQARPSFRVDAPVKELGEPAGHGTLAADLDGDEFLVGFDLNLVSVKLSHRYSASMGYTLG